jgi:hypothetical protein
LYPNYDIPQTGRLLNSASPLQVSAIRLIELRAFCGHGPELPSHRFEDVQSMPVSMSQASLSVFEIGLNALLAVLDKGAAHAAAKKIEPTVLIGWRLAPDMFAFGRQVLVACDQAKNGAARLAGVEPPKFDDNEATLDQFRERISKTLAYLKTLDAKSIDASADREITFPLGSNKGQMKGVDYLNHFVLPNFYFHLTAAYAVLRNLGVDLGKRDFLGAIPLKRI